MTFIYQKVKHAWYSPKMAARAGSCFYRVWDKPTQSVEITIVCDSDQHGCGWDDMRYVGQVCEYVRPGQQHNDWIGRERAY